MACLPEAGEGVEAGPRCGDLLPRERPASAPQAPLKRPLELERSELGPLGLCWRAKTEE